MDLIKLERDEIMQLKAWQSIKNKEIELRNWQFWHEFILLILNSWWD
jgi:hypothetical protein